MAKPVLASLVFVTHRVEQQYRLTPLVHPRVSACTGTRCPAFFSDRVRLSFISSVLERACILL